MSNILDVEKLRNDFPGLSTKIDNIPATYLDSAATSLKPKIMVEALEDYYLGMSTNVHRGKSYSLELVSNNYEGARTKVAQLIGCSANEVVFVRNTTEAINMVALGSNLSKKDLVVVCSDAHHSNMLPWMRSARVEFVRVRENGEIDLNHYQDLVKQQPKFVALNHCSNVTGIYLNLELMIQLAKKYGARVLVDGAQSIPHRRLNLNLHDIDYLAFSAHKMLGPTGIGVLYGKRAQLEALTPSFLGGGMVDFVSQQGFELRKIPHRFEAGTPHIAGAYGFTAAIDYLLDLGFKNIEQHDRKLGTYMLQEALKRDYVSPLNPGTEHDRGAVVSLRLRGVNNLDDIARVLSDSYGLICRSGHLCAQPYVDKLAQGQVLRISAYIYNDELDIEKFFNALDEISQVMI